MEINRDRIQKVISRIVELKVDSIKDRTSGLSEQDIEMFNRIFNSSDPEPTYQEHFSFDPKWKARHGKTSKVKRNIR